LQAKTSAWKGWRNAATWKRIAMGEKMKQLFPDTTSPAGSQVVLSAQEEEEEEEEEEAVVVSMRSLLVKNIG
jgi:hypothetical protein